MAKEHTTLHVPKGWQRTDDGNRIHRTLKTRDFMEAVGLVNAIADVAEELEHHPDLHIESWNTLRIETYSHDVGHLTDRDERLARRINELLGD